MDLTHSIYYVPVRYPEETPIPADVEIETACSTRQIAADVQRIVEVLEAGTPFEIRIVAPPDATIAFEQERTAEGEKSDIATCGSAPE